MSYAVRNDLGAWPGLTKVKKTVTPPALTFAQWTAAVRARGNAVVYMPSGPSKGQLAERYKDKQGTFRHALAPASVLKEMAPPTTYSAWTAWVKKRGNVATYMPEGPNQGLPAERYRDQQGVFRYALPPAKVLADWRGRVQLPQQHAITTQQNIDAIQAGFKDVAREIVELPAKVIEEATGIPSWLFPILAIAAGGLVAKSLLR